MIGYVVYKCKTILFKTGSLEYYEWARDFIHFCEGQILGHILCLIIDESHFCA